MLELALYLGGAFWLITVLVVIISVAIYVTYHNMQQEIKIKQTVEVHCFFILTKQKHMQKCLAFCLE